MENKIVVSGPIFDGSAPGIINQGLIAAMYEATMLLERKVKERTPVGVGGAKGGLLSTIHSEVQKGGSVVKGIVATSSKYGEVREKGRTPGKKWPPEGTLIRWIELKLGKHGSEAKSLEFVIRRKIGRKGFTGAYMFGRAFESHWPEVARIFNRAGYTISRGLSGAK